MRKIVGAIAAVVLGVPITSALAAAMLVATTALPARAQQTPADLSVVVTNGVGVIKRAPDRAFVTIAAESRAKTPVEALMLLFGPALEMPPLRLAVYGSEAPQPRATPPAGLAV